MTQEIPSRDWHGAHHPWEYRPHCFRWQDSYIAGINFLPLATHMRAWLRQEGNLLLAPEAGLEGKSGYTNPYAFSGAALGLILGRVINASYDYSQLETPEHNAIDAEVERLRLHCELVLHTARFCEVVIKQLLYCTAIPEKQYERMALGALLDSPCPSCKKENGKKPHTTSLVGTLAHPFFLCFEFEGCAMDHMALVNKRRNTQAAHSDIQALNIRTVSESRAQLATDTQEVLEQFSHLLSHLEKLEDKMLDDLASKGEAIVWLRVNGLAAEDCNFNLEPGRSLPKPQIRLGFKAAASGI